MDAYEPFVSLGLALFAGLLLGMEREQSRPPPEPNETFLGGVRTFPLVALVGAISALVSREVGPAVLVVVTVGVLLLALLPFARDLFLGGSGGATSETAFVLAYLLGALSATEVLQPMSRRFFVVCAAAVGATLLLSVKPSLHGFIRRASREDVLATLKLLMVALVVLPLLPDRTFGPLDVLNPFRIGLMAVFIAGIGFVGYVAVRLLGANRGLALTGALGGLVSSTAVTLASSARARQTPALAGTCALAVVLASSLMFARVLVEVAVVNASLLSLLAIPVGAMAVGGGAASVLLYLRHQRPGEAGEAVQVENPFELSSALKFALLYAGVLLGAKAAVQYLGDRGTFLAAVLAGVTDVDAITLSMSSLSGQGQISPRTAATAIVLGAASNTVTKAALALVAGGWAFGRKVLMGIGATLLGGMLGLGALWLRGAG